VKNAGGYDVSFGCRDNMTSDAVQSIIESGIIQINVYQKG